jgi:hypothetical protein
VGGGGLAAGGVGDDGRFAASIAEEVVGVVADGELAGSGRALLMPLAAAQALFGQPDAISAVLVSNGDAERGAAQDEAARALLAGVTGGLVVNSVKVTALESQWALFLQPWRVWRQAWRETGRRHYGAALRLFLLAGPRAVTEFWLGLLARGPILLGLGCGHEPGGAVCD